MMISRKVLGYLFYLTLGIIFTVSQTVAGSPNSDSQCNIEGIIFASEVTVKRREVPQQCYAVWVYDKKIDLDKLERCLQYSPSILDPIIIDGLFNCHYSFSQTELDQILNFFMEDSFLTEHTTVIKKLIDAGASTKNFNVKIYYGNDIACGAVQLVLEANKGFYENNSLLDMEINGFSRWLDLHFLTNTGIGRNLCSEAISTLVGINKDLINFQSEYDNSIPLHEYLYDISHPEWSMEIAKLLISENNINLQTKQGNTALHYLLLYNEEGTDKIAELLKISLDMGADLTLENEEGITVKGLMSERIDLISSFK